MERVQCVEEDNQQRGRTKLVLLATDDDRPGFIKSATFHFPGWAELSETFDVLAEVAGIVQETCQPESEHAWAGGDSSVAPEARCSVITRVAGLHMPGRAPHYEPSTRGGAGGHSNGSDPF